MSKDNPLEGKKVTAVYLATDDKAIRFDTEDGNTIIARTEGDCCSHTWIESIDAPELLVEGTVHKVEPLHMANPPNQPDYGVIRRYGCKITTTKGRCVIDYRNKSNGYYGGSLRWPDERFYPGVFEQNVSDENWNLVAERGNV